MTCQHEQLSQIDESVDRIDGTVMSLDQRLEQIGTGVTAVVALLNSLLFLTEELAIRAGKITMAQAEEFRAIFPMPDGIDS